MYSLKYDIYTPLDSFHRYEHVETDLVLGGRNDQKPFFSIMIPTYKRIDTLVLSVESALGQVGFDNYEIVIVDNDSNGINGETRAYLSGITSDKIKYYVNRENIGMCGNWNRCIKMCSGKYIIMLHDDDMLAPDCLKTLYEVIIRSDYPTVLGVGYEVFNESHIPQFQKSSKVSFQYIDKKDFFFGESLNIAGLTFKKDFMYKMGGFADEYYPNEDSYFIYQAIVHGKVVKISNVLAGYRVEDNLSLKDDTLEKIVYMTEKMRETISMYEPFAKRFMRKYDLEYLYDYIQGANRYWSKDLDYRKIFKMCEMKRDKTNRFKIFRLKLKILYYKNIKMRWKKKYILHID